MFNNVILDAVRVAERESRSAMPTSPVMAERLAARSGPRLAASTLLRRLADAIEPAARVPAERKLAADSFGGC